MTDTIKLKLIEKIINDHFEFECDNNRAALIKLLECVMAIIEFEEKTK